MIRRTSAPRAPRPRRTSPKGPRMEPLILTTERRRSPPRSRARALFGDVQAGVRDHGVQRAQSGPAVGAPVVEVAVLPPPQRLERAPGLIVLEAVDEIGGHVRDVVRDPERQAQGVLV